VLAGLHFFLESVRKNFFFCLSQLLGATHIPLHIPYTAESTCNAEDPGSISGLKIKGKTTGEGIGSPLQYFWASLVAQRVKNPPVMWETWVWSLGWEDSLEKGKATPSSILAWRIPCTVQSMGLQRVGHDWATFTSHSLACGPFFYLQSCNTASFWPFFHPHISLSSQPGKVLHLQGLCD